MSSNSPSRGQTAATDAEASGVESEALVRPKVLRATDHAKQRLRRYLRAHPEGVSTGTLDAWISSVRKHGGITYEEFKAALSELRSEGFCACTNGRWWMREQKYPDSLRGTGK